MNDFACIGFLAVGCLIVVYAGTVLGRLVLLFIDPPRTCTHNNTHIRTISAVHTCETTALYCLDCGEQLTKPKQDCR